ncbi:hypothetical protein M947_08510 [Sulfurimonas hongkongensis]|uniref:Uncharacterized protein n=1 Tax=Sulfurimonas hongkongensis TaxID=1172190 RepID=T0JQU2_9BACT|nr:hypothetical protein [Sulfurimonas hongkongensis]EQB39187.1 hypothetical protein M947_08510 [Sulfurimonas hongkongensis]
MCKEKILIFGVGVAGRALYRELNSTHNIIGFIDNNKRLDGTKYNNKKIHSLDKLPLLSFDKIAITGIWVNSMKNQLQSLNIKDSKIMEIADNAINFSTQSRTKETDNIMKNISQIFTDNKIDYYIIGSSLATLFRNKDLSSVADVDLFLTSQKDAISFYDFITTSPLFKEYDIEKVLYLEDEILVKKGDIKKIIISSKSIKAQEEPSIIDISIADFLDEKYMVRHGVNYIYIPKNLCEGLRYHKYKDLELQIPFLAEDYLCLLYGKNWIIPPKKWDQSDYGNLLSPVEVQKLKESLGAR